MAVTDDPRPRDDARRGHRIDLDAPANGFTETFLLGNGRLGAAVHGTPGSERIDLNTDTFWSGGPTTGPQVRDDDPAAWLAPVREAVRRGDRHAAERLAEHLRSASFSEAYQPLGALVWDHGDPGSPVSGYRRTLALDDAEATSAFVTDAGTTILRAFVSAVDAVLVLELESPAADGDPSGLERLRFESPHPSVERIVLTGQSDVVTWAGRGPAVALPLYLGDVTDPVRYSADSPDQDGTVASGMGFVIAASVQQTAPGRTRVLVTADDGFRGRGARPSADLDDLRRRAADRLRALAGTPTETLRDRHRAEHHGWYDRSGLTVGSSGSGHADGALVERFFNLGRYLLIASSRPGTQPANLQGIWNDEVRPGWSCNHTTNINLEMNYWSAAPTGLGALTEPFTTFVDDLVASGTRTAETFYRLPGWTVHHNSDVWGFTAPACGFSSDSAHHANWPAGGAWLVNQVVDIHRRHGGSGAGAVPTAVLDEAARFVLGWLEPGVDGLLHTNPSTSPEHDFVVDGTVASVSAGAAMDQQLVQELLANVVEYSQDRELVDTARAAVERLRPPAVQGGVLLEWSEPWTPLDRGHRHLSHLVGLFPGRVIDRDDTPERYRAARAALLDRVENGSGHTGWSQAWICCLAAHVADAELVGHSLDVLVDGLTSSSLLDLHPVDDHPSGSRFQIDGNLGGTAGIVEALVQSRAQRIRLLRGVPTAWRHGSIRGVRVEGQHMVDLEWDGDGAVSVTIEAAQDDALRIECPGVVHPDRSSATARPAVVDGVEATIIEWRAQKGSTLTIRR